MIDSTYFPNMPKKTTRGKGIDPLLVMRRSIQPKRGGRTNIWNTGGAELTKLRLDPYYTRKIQGKGKIKDWLKRVFGKKKESQEEIDRLNAEIMRDIQGLPPPAVPAPVAPVPAPAPKTTEKPQSGRRPRY